MDDARKVALVERIARLMLDQQDVLNGLFLFSGDRMLTKKEMCDIGREALDLIERGEVQ